MSEDIQGKSASVKVNYGDLFKPGLLLKTAASTTIWMIAGFTYYGFNQYVSQTSPDPFLTVATVGIIQVCIIDFLFIYFFFFVTISINNFYLFS